MKLPAFFAQLLINQFRWLAAGLVIGIFVLGYVALIADKIQTIQTTGFLEQKKVQAQLDSRREFLAALQESVAQFAVALPPEKLKAIDDFIPTGADFPGLLLTVRNIASAANLDLNHISISETGQVSATGPTASAESNIAAAPTTVKAATVAGVNLQVQDATITVSGGQSYAAFKNFLALIESSRRLLDVVSLGFSIGGEGAGQVANDYSLHVRTYFLPRPSQ